MSLDLSGNRLTTPPKVEYFKGNQHLHEISLYDNPWRCDCEHTSSKDSYFNFNQNSNMFLRFRWPVNFIKIVLFLGLVSPSPVYGSTSPGMDDISDRFVTMIAIFLLVILGLPILAGIGKYFYKIIARRTRWIYEWIRRRVCGEQRINLDPSAQELGQDSREADPPPYH